MSDKFIKKIINISFVVIFVFLISMSGFNFFKAMKNKSSFEGFKDKLSEQGNNNDENSDLIVPIEDSNKGDVDSNFNNVGAKYDKDVATYKFEILNLEVLSKVIPTSKNELYEVYHSTLLQISEQMKYDIYSYIDESTISYKDSKLRFSLLDYSNDKKISDIVVPIKTNGSNENSSVITEFKIENLESLTEHLPKNPDYLIYVYELITNEVKKNNPSAKGCVIDVKSISKLEKSVSFNVLDLSKKTKIKTITLEN